MTQTFSSLQGIFDCFYRYDSGIRCVQTHLSLRLVVFAI
jgi:hypothetical protein